MKKTFEELIEAALVRLEEDRLDIKNDLKQVDPDGASFLHTCLIKNNALFIELARLRLKEMGGKDEEEELRKQAGDIYNAIGDSFSGRTKDDPS